MISTKTQETRRRKTRAGSYCPTSHDFRWMRYCPVTGRWLMKTSAERKAANARRRKRRIAQASRRKSR